MPKPSTPPAGPSPTPWLDLERTERAVHDARTPWDKATAAAGVLRAVRAILRDQEIRLAALETAAAAGTPPAA